MISKKGKRKIIYNGVKYYWYIKYPFIYIISEDKNLYHGTSIENKGEILKNRKFNLSSSASEWAGSGIYFFIDVFYKNCNIFS